MERVEEYLRKLQSEALRDKKIAQAMGVFLKTHRAKMFVQSAVAMEGETVSSVSLVSSETLILQVSVKNLEGMKDERLQGILSTFEFLNPDETSSEDYPKYHERDFMYRWVVKIDEIDLNVSVHVNAYVKSDSATCRREITGYSDDTPTPIYKLVCDDDKPKDAPAREGSDDPVTF